MDFSSRHRRLRRAQNSPMKTKLIKDLEVGNRVVVDDPPAVARITAKERSRLFQASGGCFRLDAHIMTGPNKGKNITDQHHPGDDAVRLAE